MTSGTPNDAASDATTTSHPSNSSKPPATAVAFAAPTIGTPISPWVNRAKPFMPSGSPPTAPPSAKARRSMPAQNAFSPVPVSTTARTSGSSSASVIETPMAVSSSGLSALRASGRLRRSTCTAPRRSFTRTGPASSFVAVSVIGSRPSSLVFLAHPIGGLASDSRRRVHQYGVGRPHHAHRDRAGQGVRHARSDGVGAVRGRAHQARPQSLPPTDERNQSSPSKNSRRSSAPLRAPAVERWYAARSTPPPEGRSKERPWQRSHTGCRRRPSRPRASSWAHCCPRRCGKD